MPFDGEGAAFRRLCSSDRPPEYLSLSHILFSHSARQKPKDQPNVDKQGRPLRMTFVPCISFLAAQLAYPNPNRVRTRCKNERAVVAAAAVEF